MSQFLNEEFLAEAYFLLVLNELDRIIMAMVGSKSDLFILKSEVILLSSYIYFIIFPYAVLKSSKVLAWNCEEFFISEPYCNVSFLTFNDRRFPVYTE